MITQDPSAQAPQSVKESRTHKPRVQPIPFELNLGPMSVTRIGKCIPKILPCVQNTYPRYAGIDPHAYLLLENATRKTPRHKPRMKVCQMPTQKMLIHEL